MKAMSTKSRYPYLRSFRQEKPDGNFVKLVVIKEEQPYLVAGKSAVTGQMVFGFPYWHKVRGPKKGVSRVVPCIILPCAQDDELIPDDQPYAFALGLDEFHPVIGELHRFLYEDENGNYHFDGNICFTI